MGFFNTSPYYEQKPTNLWKTTLPEIVKQLPNLETVCLSNLGIVPDTPGLFTRRTSGPSKEELFYTEKCVIEYIEHVTRHLLHTKELDLDIPQF